MFSSFTELKSAFLAGEITKPSFIEYAHSYFHSNLIAYSQDIKSTDVSSITIRDGEIVVKTRLDGISISIDPLDHRTAPIEILNFNQYESIESTFVRRISPHIHNMLDIGANIGWYSLLLSSINPQASIHAFEPIPTTFSRFRQNCELNSFDNINCYNFGFSSEPGFFPFYVYSEGTGNASMRNLANTDRADVVDCELKTLDQFNHDNLSGVTIDFLKCDVEGNELFVLQGGLNFLKQHRPVLFLEILRKWSACFGYHPNDIFVLLKNIGYQSFVLCEDSLLKPFDTVTDETIETNFFFVHPDSSLRSVLKV